MPEEVFEKAKLDNWEDLVREIIHLRKVMLACYEELEENDVYGARRMLKVAMNRY